MPYNSFENYPMSWKPVLNKGSAPLYLLLAGQLEQDIISGALKPGVKLPPQRELADYLDINVSTVSRAFKICSQKGLLSGSVGNGTYVAYHISTNMLSAAIREKPHAIELGSMMPETVEQQEVTFLLQKMMAESSFGSLFQYNHGIAEWQREAAAKLLLLAKCPALPNQVLTASGGQNALAAILAGLLKPGDKLGVDPLVYPGVKSAASLFGIQLVPVAQENGEMSEAGLLHAVKNDGIKAVYVMPGCQNPTTHCMTVQCRNMLAKMANEFNLTIIEDGITNLLMNDPGESIFSRAPEQAIFILSLSKSVDPAFRLAYLCVPAQYFHTIDDALYSMNLSQSTLLLELSSRLIASEQMGHLLHRRRAGLKLRNQLTDDILQGHTVHGGADSLSRWLLLPPGINGIRFEQAASELGVSVYSSERFAVGKNAPIEAIRLAICAPDSLNELERGLTILKKLLAETTS